MAYDLAERLQQVQCKSSQLRCEAFVDYSPEVCGVRINPLTLASYNRLIAFENTFVVGGPTDTEAVAVFVWACHPSFGQAAHRIRRRVFRRLGRALYPRFPRLNGLLRFASQLPRFHWLSRFCTKTHTERLHAVAAEIRRLVSEATHDLPLSTSTDDEQAKRQTEQPRIAMVAQMLNVFRRALQLPYHETETMPLKRLVQLLREQIYHTSGGKGLGLMSREEAAIWREHLDRKNADHAAKIRSLVSAPTTP